MIRVAGRFPDFDGRDIMEFLMNNAKRIADNRTVHGFAQLFAKNAFVITVLSISLFIATLLVRGYDSSAILKASPLLLTAVLAGGVLALQNHYELSTKEATIVI